MNGATQRVAAAQSALAKGDAKAALALVAGLGDPAGVHLRAMAYRRVGQLDEARRCFEEAMAAAPDDPSIANNFGNLLRQAGDHQGAVTLYDRALALDPGYRDAAFNKALLLSEIGDDHGALELLEHLNVAFPADGRVHSARGAVLRKLARHDTAAAAYDAALSAQPGLPSALKGRAQVALERGEGDAAARYRHAVAADPADLGAVHGYAEALEAEGSAEAIQVLEQVLQARPDWTQGHVLLARIRAERGEPDWAKAIQDATLRSPNDLSLAIALAGMLAAAERWEEALAALPEGEQPHLTAARAHYLSEAGRPTAALDLIKRMAGSSSNSAITAARAHLRLNDPRSAAAILERAVAEDADAIGAWGMLEITWRMLGDARSDWLAGQEGLVATRDIGWSGAELAELATALRNLHRTRSHPIGQSLRGGTQTRGALFLRGEPIVARLREALADQVAEYFAGLPQEDARHPLLKHRNAEFRMGGSWSVRLVGSGFHVNHIHPEGIVSSACYISLPDPGPDAAKREGWLELGRPPAELGLDLSPLAEVQPRVGRLALFPSYLFHGTRPFAQGERLSVAFDVMPA